MKTLLSFEVPRGISTFDLKRAARGLLLPHEKTPLQNLGQWEASFG